MEYRAMMCDVDGTLIANQRDALPTQRVKDTIKKAQELIQVGIATARPLAISKYIIDELALTAPCILANGVQIYDPVKKSVLAEYALPIDVIKDINQIILSLGVDCFVRDGDDRILLSTSYQPQKPLTIFVPPIEESSETIFLKEISQIPNILCHRMVSWQQGRSDFLITHQSATKQQAVLEVARILGIETSEMIGVGDGYNDFPLLMACGLRVAMGNAVEDLKAIADYIARSVEEDGVADVIETYVLKQVDHQ